MSRKLVGIELSGTIPTGVTFASWERWLLLVLVAASLFLFVRDLTPKIRDILAGRSDRSRTDRLGQRIATVRLTEIRLHAAVGGDGEVLSTTDADHPFGRWTTWTPDGTALVVLKLDPEAGQDMWRLWVVPVDGSDPVATELVLEPAHAGSVPFSVHPDGKRIVFAAGRYFWQFWAVRNLPLD